jgi:hypothetical protein
MWHRLDSTLGVTRGDAVLAAATLVLGGVVGAAISELIKHPEKADYWAVLFIGVIAAVVCAVVVGFLGAFQKDGEERLDAITSALAAVQDKVTQSVDGSAVLVPRESIYPEMARCIREATEQVVVITYFMYDWENQRRTFQPVVTGGVAGVDEFYEAIYACIGDPDVEYLRVWQVPHERIAEARPRIEEDPHLAKELALIDATEPDYPNRCRVKVIAEATTASLILVDRKTLFFNIDLFDADRQTWLSPFMLMVHDARGRAFNDLKRVVLQLSG